MSSKVIKSLKNLSYLKDLINKADSLNCNDLECAYLGIFGRYIIDNVNKFSNEQLKEIFKIIEFYIPGDGYEATIVATGFMEAFMNRYLDAHMTFDLKNLFGDKTKEFIKAEYNYKF